MTKKYPGNLPRFDQAVPLGDIDRPARPGQALTLSHIASENGWKVSGSWPGYSSFSRKTKFVLLLTHPKDRRLAYGLSWDRRQPTFDLGWWRRGVVVQCPPDWPRIGRLTEAAMRKIRWVIVTNSVDEEGGT